MALQIGGTTVIDNSRNLVNIAGGTVPNATNATNATNLTGTATSSINSSALATGTANSTTYLRGDRTWQTISVTPPTALGAVGTYALLMMAANNNLAINGTIAGSSLRYDPSYPGGSINIPTNPYSQNVTSTTSTYPGGGTAVSGTWRKMSSGTTYLVTDTGYGGSRHDWGWGLYVRVS